MEKQVRTIGIVEDEVLIAQGLERNLRKHGYRVIAPALDFEEAVQMLKSGKPDLVILDINLEAEKNGIQVAEYIRENYGIPFIFLTSLLDSSTLDAAKATEPAGYLTKPFHFESLFTTIEVGLHNFYRKTVEEEQIALKTGTRTELVKPSEILYLKTDHVYVEVYLADRILLVRKPLRELLEELPDDFFQVHRSYAVNMRHIVSFGAGIVVLSGVEVPVSRSFKDELVDRLSN